MSVRTYVRTHDKATVYCAVWYLKDGSRCVRKVRTVKSDAPQRDHDRARTAALKHSHDQRIEVENDTWVDPKGARGSRVTVHALIGRFLKNYHSRADKPRYYQNRAAHWKRLLKNKPADQLTTRDVDDFRNAREREGTTAATLRKDLVALGTMLRWAVARKYVTFNAADSKLIQRPAKPRPDPRPMSDDEVAALLGELDPGWADVVTFILETGADIGEVTALTWTKVDLSRRLIDLPRAKTGVGRSLPYGSNERLRAILERAAQQPGPSGHVFVRNGEPISFRAAQSAMWRARGAAKLSRARPFKVLRATFATRKAMEGVDVPTIAALMGLTSSHVFEHYIRPTGAHLESAMASSTQRRTKDSISE